MKNMPTLIFTICINSLLLFPTFSLGATNEKIYTFGIVPQFDANRTFIIWRPILDEIQNRTGLKFSIRGSTTISSFEQEFSEGVFDFVYMNPYHILLANKKGYIPLVMDKGKKLYGIVVVHKDSPIFNVEDLNGKEIAFPAPNALGASLLPRSDFRNKFNINIKPKYVKTHTSVYLNVATRQVEAGGGVQKSFTQQKPELRDALRIIYETQRFSPHPISAHSRVTKNVYEKVREALLAMGSTEKGKTLLANIPIQKIGVAEMVDYAPIGELGLESLYQE